MDALGNFEQTTVEQSCERLFGKEVDVIRVLENGDGAPLLWV